MVRLRPQLTSLALLIALSGSACQRSDSADSDPGSASGAPTAAGDDGEPDAGPAEAARSLCSPLRDWENELVAIVNTTTSAVGDIDDPGGRAERTLEGYDELIATTRQFRSDLEEVTVEGTPDGQRAADDLRSGADEAVATLEDERTEFETETGGAVTDADLHGRMGQFLISLETTYSAAEPTASGYEDRAFKRAILDEPHCEHVIQPFRLDGSG